MYRLAQINLSVIENVQVSLLLGFKKIMFHIFPITNIISTQCTCNELGLSYFYINRDDQSGYADLKQLAMCSYSFVRFRRPKSIHIC